MIPIKFAIAGNTSSNKSKQFDPALSYNVYMSTAENGRIGTHDFPGLKAFGTQAGVDRGFHVMAGTLYKICGTSLYSVSSAGTYTVIGAVAGTGRAVFTDDGDTLGFVADGVIYQYSSGTLSTVTQTVITGVKWIALLNNQWIIGGNNQQFAVSDAGTITTWNALNFAAAEQLGDDLVRGYVFGSLLYLLGSESTEPWYNSGVGNPPFDRQDTALVNTGIAGVYAVGNTDQYMYWLGNDRKVYQCIGASARTVSTPGIYHIISGLSTVSDCIVSTFTFEGQDMVLFQFPTAAKTLLYSETFNYWVELGSGSSYQQYRWYGNAVTQCYGKNMVADYRNGNVYELDLDTFTDNGDPRYRVRQFPVAVGEAAGLVGRRITLCQMRLNMQRGVGLPTGQGSDPVLMCYLSPDGGHTFGPEEQVSIGSLGAYVEPVDVYQFATGYEIVAKIACSDPVHISMWDGIAYVVDAGY